MDVIFKALSDDTRRRLLDMLHEHDGQTLTELEQQLGMTRFGVMKHLKILEEASLVVTRRSGRFKYHYLNAVPLQQVIDRWIEPLVQKPMARLAIDLKTQLEGPDPMTTQTKTEEKPDFVLETFIATTPEQLWEALTEGDHMQNYHFAGASLRPGTLAKGSRFDQYTSDGAILVGGEILEIDPPVRLEVTFEPGWGDQKMTSSRCVYEIEQQGPSCKLTILHYGIPADQDEVREGWARMISGLKTYLETGKSVQFSTRVEG